MYKETFLSLKFIIVATQFLVTRYMNVSYVGHEIISSFLMCVVCSVSTDHLLM
jgi:hypothetical protein